MGTVCEQHTAPLCTRPLTVSIGPRPGDRPAHAGYGKRSPRAARTGPNGNWPARSASPRPACTASGGPSGCSPWRTEDAKISPDPLLIDKIRDVIGLYLAPPANAVVFAVDEKPQIQALQRTAPVLPMIPGTPGRRSFDYVRHGTIDLFAALNTATGKVIGQLSAQHRAVDFRDFLDEIDRQADPGLAIHVICDNLSAHKAPVVHKWLLAHPRVQLHFTPTYSSWISQVPGGSPSCSAAAWTAACSAHPANSPPRWRNGSRSGMPAPGPSGGPRPPIRSSTASAATAHASPDRDTSRPRAAFVAGWHLAVAATPGGNGVPGRGCGMELLAVCLCGLTAHGGHAAPRPHRARPSVRRT